MGEGDDRDSSAMMQKLQDAKLSENGNMRAMISDTIKKITINGKGVSGGGLSFTIGDVGLGVDTSVRRSDVQFPQSQPLPAPVPTENFRPAPQPVDLRRPTPPGVTPRPVPRPIPESDEPDESISISTGGRATVADSTPGVPTVVTGAVNGVSATITLLAVDDWTEIE